MKRPIVRRGPLVAVLLACVAVSPAFAQPRTSASDLLGGGSSEPLGGARTRLYGQARISANAASNVWDLSSGMKGDRATYGGFLYQFAFDRKAANGDQIYVLAQDNGPADFNAPFWSDGTINSLFGDVKLYHDRELLPEIGAFWADYRIPGAGYRLKAGLFSYSVGGGYALGGKDENYGLSLSGDGLDYVWTLHWERPDYNYRWNLGPTRRDERNQTFHHVTANFYAADIVLKFGTTTLQPYIGVLHDRTPPAHRVNTFTASTIKEDTLGTLGFELLRRPSGTATTWGLEVATNFGNSNHAGPGTDVIHEGYLAAARHETKYGLFTETLRLVFASGPNIGQAQYDAATPGVTPQRKHNKTFSTYSPTNTNVVSSHYPKALGPWLAMAGAWTINYGTPRPGVFNDPHIFENLIMPSIGISLSHLDPFSVSLNYYYLRSIESGWGRSGGITKPLDNDLGQELDVYLGYKVSDSLTIDAICGYFIPGAYYREARDLNLANYGLPGGPYYADAENRLGFSPNLRSDGKADNAWQVEIGATIRF